MPPLVLSACVALVTGASRGAGRGIALALGSAGATVYVTGRSTLQSSTEDLPGTIEETAALVTQRGGQGYALKCDHTDDLEVQAVFAQIQQEQGRLDVLVNNVWGGYEYYDVGRFEAPFWEQPLRHWEGMFTAGLRAHLTASQQAARLMIPAQQGLIVSTTAWDHEKYLGNLFYDVAKSSIARMAWGMARELRRYHIASVALAPGFIRTERVLAVFGVNEEDHQSIPDLEQTESPEYIGRAIAALAADEEVLEKSGQVLYAGELAREYGFTDIDGRYIPPFVLPDNIGEVPHEE